jgi:hypothetical protein
MNTKEFNEIAAAYAAVYLEAEQLDEISQKTATRAFATRATNEFESDSDNPKDFTKSGKSKADVSKSRIEKKFGKKAGAHAERAAHAGIFGRKSFSMPKKPTNEEVDVFDVIVEHLLSEGYADTAESATAILANMSEDWRDSILEAQEARDNPEKYEQGKEKEEHKKYGKVRGESRPMPPRGNKDREAFEKWYATQRG